MTDVIRTALRDSIAVKTAIVESPELLAAIQHTATKMVTAARAGATIFVCGNGGSSCDAMHFVEELVARYKRDRPGIRAQHFSEPGILTCWSNDYEFASVFERQAETFCKPGDVLVGISTSGNSENVRRAIAAAKRRSSWTVGLLGRDGGKIKSECDQALVVPSPATERIQEAHITVIHILCELVESTLYP